MFTPNQNDKDKRTDERAEPGEKGTGDFYRIEIRDSEEFETFRTHDVGDPGGIERIAGKRTDDSWDTQTWLVSKNIAKPDGDSLKPISKDVEELFDGFESLPKHVKGDIYKARIK